MSHLWDVSSAFAFARMHATVNNVTGGLCVCDLNIRRSPETCLPWVISDAASVVFSALPLYPGGCSESETTLSIWQRATFYKLNLSKYMKALVGGQKTRLDCAPRGLGFNTHATTHRSSRTLAVTCAFCNI